MKKAHVLYNPLAGNGKCNDDVKRLSEFVTDEIVYYDLTAYDGNFAFLSDISEEDYIILVGGDGTLNHFANAIDGMDIKCDILYFPGGSGNDFAHDVGKDRGDAPFSIKDYIASLPVVFVNGIRRRFVNGVGYGLDGYCCQQGNELRKKTTKPINYTAIALKGLAYDYKPTPVKVTVDGKTREYKKVWMVPTMFGRYFGGGMMATPHQDRCNRDGTVMLMVLHDCPNLRVLWEFPKVYKGKHVNLHKIIDFISGHEITVECQNAGALQLDGETVTDVKGYTVKTATALRRDAEKKAKEEVAVH